MSVTFNRYIVWFGIVNTVTTPVDDTVKDTVTSPVQIIVTMMNNAVFTVRDLRRYAIHRANKLGFEMKEEDYSLQITRRGPVLFLDDVLRQCLRPGDFDKICLTVSGSIKEREIPKQLSEEVDPKHECAIQIKAPQFNSTIVSDGDVMINNELQDDDTLGTFFRKVLSAMHWQPGHSANRLHIVDIFNVRVCQTYDDPSFPYHTLRLSEYAQDRKLRIYVYREGEGYTAHHFCVLLVMPTKVEVADQMMALMAMSMKWATARNSN